MVKSWDIPKEPGADTAPGLYANSQLIIVPGPILNTRHYLSLYL